MHDGPPDLVWYVSYGSNLHRDRFQSYLEGGRMPGGLRADAGCRDPSEPVADAETAGKIFKVLDALEDLDDVQNVFSNEDVPEEILEQLED